jgi:ketosteroid isomerase-like protein
VRAACGGAEGEPSYNRAIAKDVGTELIDAIAAQDAARIEACFTADAVLRALTPPGFRERQGAADTAALIAGWFADSTVLELAGSHTETVGDRLHVT